MCSLQKHKYFYRFIVHPSPFLCLRDDSCGLVCRCWIRLGHNREVQLTTIIGGLRRLSPEYPSHWATEAIFSLMGSSITQIWGWEWTRAGTAFNRYSGRGAWLSLETQSDDGWKRRYCVEGRSIAATELSVFLSLWSWV